MPYISMTLGLSCGFQVFCQPVNLTDKATSGNGVKRSFIALLLFVYKDIVFTPRQINSILGSAKTNKKPPVFTTNGSLN